MEKFIVVNMGKDRYEKLYPHHEQYVIVNSKAIVKIFGDSVSSGKKGSVDSLVKITAKRKTIYRKCICAAIENIEHVEMGYRSQASLGITAEQIGQKVQIEPTNWFCYLWNHVDLAVRYSFRVALAMGVISIVFSVCSLF